MSWSMVMDQDMENGKWVTTITTICRVILLSGFKTRYQAPMERLACFILRFFPFWAFNAFISESIVERWGRKRWGTTCNKRSPDGLEGMLRFLVSVLIHKPQGFPASLVFAYEMFQQHVCLTAVILEVSGPSYPLIFACHAGHERPQTIALLLVGVQHEVLEPGGRDLLIFNCKSISEVGHNAL